jgi:hypothetical protein
VLKKLTIFLKRLPLFIHTLLKEIKTRGHLWPIGIAKEETRISFKIGNKQGYWCATGIDPEKSKEWP